MIRYKGYFNFTSHACKYGVAEAIVINAFKMYKDYDVPRNLNRDDDCLTLDDLIWLCPFWSEEKVIEVLKSCIEQKLVIQYPDCFDLRVDMR